MKITSAQTVQRIKITHGRTILALERINASPPRNARLGGEAINGNLVVGASVQVTFVMNVATGMSVTR